MTLPSLPSLPTLNPAAVAATHPSAGAAKAAGTPGADPAGRAEGFARALDRAAAKRDDAAAHQTRERDRPPGAAASRHEPTDPSRRSDGACNGRRAAAQDKKGADADCGEADRATPAEASGDATADEAIDVAALIGGPAGGARPEAAKPDAAQLPTAAAFGQAVASATCERDAPAFRDVDRAVNAPQRAQDRPARDRAAAALADADARDAASAAGATPAARRLATASPAEVGPGREPFGHRVEQAAQERHAAGEPAPVAGAGPTPRVDDASLPPVATQVPRNDAAGALRHADLHEPVGSPRFAPALGARVVTLVRDGVEQAQVRLNPAELGPIAVHIRIDGTRAEVDFSAAHALTRQALQDAVPALAGALRESGLTLAGGGVFEQPRESRDADAAPRGEPGARSGPHGSAESPTAVPARARARGIVDLFA